MPFFSIIIPTYNRSKKLKQAIDSVLAQTFTDFEILVIDDGSTDDTPEIIAEYKDQRIIYQWDTNSGGPARPRNRGLKIAKGEWICFLDADDWWTPNKLEACLDYIKMGNVDFIYHDLFIVREKRTFWDSRVIKSEQIKNPVLINLLVNGNVIANSSVVVRKRLIDEIGGINEDPKMIAAEDYHAWLRIARLTDLFQYVPKSLGYYMLHDEGISQKDMSDVYQYVTKGFVNLLNKKQLSSVETLISYMRGRHHYVNGRFEFAAKEFRNCKAVNAEIWIKVLYMSIQMMFKGSRNKE
jgi:glycosyltransferase involved in cell wall biosynthesis